MTMCFACNLTSTTWKPTPLILRTMLSSRSDVLSQQEKISDVCSFILSLVRQVATAIFASSFINAT